MAAPANDNIANAQVLTSGTQVTGDNTEATVEPGELRGDTAGVGPTVWYQWKCPTPAPGSVQFDTIGSSFDTHLAIFRKNVASPSGWANLNFLAKDDDAGGSGTSLLTFTPLPGVTYWIQVAGFDGAAFGAFTFNYPTPATTTGVASNNDIANATTLVPGTTSTGLVDNSGCTAETSEVTGTGDSSSTVSAAGHQTVWWRWVAPYSGSATITTAGSLEDNLTTTLDTYLTVFKAKSGVSEPVTDVTDLDCVASDDDVSGVDFSSSVTFTAVEGTVYYVQARCLTAGALGYYAITFPSPAVEDAENLFTSQTPALGNQSDGSPGITTATTIKFATAGTVPGVRFFATTTVSGTYTVALWSVDSSDPGTGTLLASKTMQGAPTPGTWTSVNFDNPVSVNTTTLYRAGVFSSAGRYVATTSFFGSDLVNGNITADANGDTVAGKTISQGTFRIDSSIGYPNSPGAGSSYFADVNFQPAGGPATHNADATLPAFGSLSGTATRDTSTTAALAGTGTLTGTAARTVSTTVSLAGTGAVTATAVRTQDATVTLAATAGLAATGAKTTTSTVTLGATGTLTADGTAGAEQTVTLASTGSLTATVDRTAIASGTLQGTGALSATAALTAVDIGLLVGVGALTGTVTRATSAMATLAGLGALSTTAIVVPPGDATSAPTSALRTATRPTVLSTVSRPRTLSTGRPPT